MFGEAHSGNLEVAGLNFNALGHPHGICTLLDWHERRLHKLKNRPKVDFESDFLLLLLRVVLIQG